MPSTLNIQIPKVKRVMTDESKRKAAETRARNKAAKAEPVIKAEPKSNAAAAPANAPAVEQPKKKGPPPMSPGKRAAATAKRLQTLAAKKATAEATVAKVLTVRKEFVDVHDKPNGLKFSINCHTVTAARGLFAYMSTVMIHNPKGYSNIFEDLEPESNESDSESEADEEEGEFSDEEE
jgi:pyruvate/2-oxoglutarate dehydrogenase complex dihydrolipoamide acyltransferase (E2) component